jgi:hypothetical protein
MPPTLPLPNGKPHPKGERTHEQIARFQTMRDPAFELGVARAEFVNTVIHPDGSTSTDTAAMIQAAERAVAEALSGDATDPKTFDRAGVASRKVQEVVSHIAAHRFVFLVDVNYLPTTYLQAATPENVDLFPPPAAEPPAGTSPEGDAPATSPDAGPEPCSDSEIRHSPRSRRSPRRSMQQ